MPNQHRTRSRVAAVAFVSLSIALTGTMWLPTRAGTTSIGGWQDGRTALLQQTDLHGYGYVSPPQDAVQMFAGSKACFGTSWLPEQLTTAGQDVAVGSVFSTRAEHMLGGKYAVSFAIRTPAGENGATYSTLASPGFWDCALGAMARQAATRHVVLNAEPTTTVTGPAGVGESRTLAIITRSETTDSSHTSWTNHEDVVVMRQASTIALLVLGDNDGPFPASERVMLTRLTDRRVSDIAKSRRATSQLASASSERLTIGVVAGLGVTAALALMTAWIAMRYGRHPRAH